MITNESEIRSNVVANGMPWHSEIINVYLKYQKHLVLGTFGQVVTLPSYEPTASYFFVSTDGLVNSIELDIPYPFEEAWNKYTRRNIPMSEIRFYDEKLRKEIRWWDEWTTYYAQREKNKQENSNIVDWNKYLKLKK